MRLGVLTGGGDCPGLNAVLRGLVRRGVNELGYEFVVPHGDKVRLAKSIGISFGV